MSSSINRCGRPTTDVSIHLYVTLRALGHTQRYGRTPSQRLCKDGIAIRQRRTIFKSWQSVLSNDRIDFCLCAFEHQGMLHQSEEDMRDGRDSLSIKGRLVVTRSRGGQDESHTYRVHTGLPESSARRTRACQINVPDLPAYIEFAVHLRSKSCCLSSPSLFSI